ncbi:MAG: hypothetical protein CME70_15360 [Halobacteriovorax sp.]|nr:hypothetical protein [Halobacteriovorax sp.]|tara:strand:- start:59184 stop:59729 length:546 start_codon:yes stop_codon:yes gene_type:complete
MKYLFLFFALINMANADEQFIVDPGVQIKSGYGNSEMFISYDRANPDVDFNYVSKGCYSGKINRYKNKMAELESEDFIFTNTEIYKNIVPGTEKEVATFLVTYVKDTYEGNWELDDTGASEEEDLSGPRARPADYLVYRFIHFECELKPETRVHDQSRKEGKDTKTYDIPSTGSGSKGMKK